MGGFLEHRRGPGQAPRVCPRSRCPDRLEQHLQHPVRQPPHRVPGDVQAGAARSSAPPSRTASSPPPRRAPAARAAPRAPPTPRRDRERQRHLRVQREHEGRDGRAPSGFPAPPAATSARRVTSDPCAAKVHADLLARLADGRVGVGTGPLLLTPAAGEGHVPGPGIVGVLGAADQQHLGVAAAAALAQDRGHGGAGAVVESIVARVGRQGQARQARGHGGEIERGVGNGHGTAGSVSHLAPARRGYA